MTKGLITGLGIGLAVLVSVLLYQNFAADCPCGFKYDAFHGCVVDLNPPPCTGNGGGSTPPGSSSGGNTPGLVDPYFPTPPTRCKLYVTNCANWPDFNGVEFTLMQPSPTLSTSSKSNVKVAVQQRDKNGVSCAAIQGDIDVAEGAVTKIPFDAGQLAGMFPLATTSATGPPTGGLVASFATAGSCRATLTEMVVFPTVEPTCGCKVSFTRD